MQQKLHNHFLAWQRHKLGFPVKLHFLGIFLRCCQLVFRLSRSVSLAPCVYQEELRKKVHFTDDLARSKLRSYVSSQSNKEHFPFEGPAGGRDGYCSNKVGHANLIQRTHCTYLSIPAKGWWITFWAATYVLNQFLFDTKPFSNSFDLFFGHEKSSKVSYTSFALGFAVPMLVKFLSQIAHCAISLQ